MGETYTVGGGRSDYRLPTVSSADNGKILKVVEGEWNKAENSGGGGSGLVFFGMTVEYGEEEDSFYIPTDKITEYYNNLENGMIPVFHEGNQYYSLSELAKDTDSETRYDLQFALIGNGGDYLETYLFVITLTSNNAIVRFQTIPYSPSN